MNAIMVKLKCLTNMHVGNGDVNYNIIDNEVEKDAVTGYPVINSSGVKGALRSFLKGNTNCSAWFGPEHGSGNTECGKLKILGAEMLAIPMRASKGENAYYMVSTKDALERFNSQAEIFGLSARVKRSGDGENEGIGVEGFSPVAVWDGIYEISAGDMASYSLPVMARNHLDNGVSKNLWYEEVVPHESIFYFPVVSDDKSLLDEFSAAVNGQVIQFGGNASIGYGLCKVTVEG